MFLRDAARTTPDSDAHPPRAADARLAELSSWLEHVLGDRGASISPASADASFRRYFRIALSRPAPIEGFDASSRTLIAMDGPPPQEDCRPFVRVAALFAEAGLNAPRVLAADIDRGFLLLTDLGRETYLDALSERTASTLFADARHALVRWQRATREGVLPEYDEPLLARELDLFPTWYVARHLGIELSPSQRSTLSGVFRLLIDRALAQPRVFVHRDYMPRNLMVCDPNPGILDFQDAVHGPITYDVVSLYRDAFVSWPPELVVDGAVRYWEDARRAGLPVRADFASFWEDFEWIGLQRHLKVLGIFARINYRDGKPHYLADTPRFVGYVREVAARYRPLAPLAKLMDEIEPRALRTQYTF